MTPEKAIAALESEIKTIQRILDRYLEIGHPGRKSFEEKILVYRVAIFAIKKTAEFYRNNK